MFNSFALSTTQLGYCVAAAFCFIVAVVATFKCKSSQNIGKSFCAALYVNALWLGSVALNKPASLFSDDPLSSEKYGVIGSSALVLETLHYSVWALALTKLCQNIRPNFIPRKLRVLIYSIAISIPIVTLAFSRSQVFWENILNALAWHGIIFSMLNLLVIEQLYRSAATNRLVRLLCICLGLNFLLDAVLYSEHFLGLMNPETAWQVRAGVCIITYTLMTVGILSFQGEPAHKARVSFSQPAVFYSMSLTTTGTILLLLALGSYYIKLKSTSLAAISYSVFTVLAIVSITLALTSSKVRQRLNVFINKHLFNYKYDYRNEWLNLIRGLSQPIDHDEFAQQAVNVTASLFRCDGAALFKSDGATYAIFERYGEFEELSSIREPTDSKFCQYLTDAWVFAPNSESESSASHNELLPEWVKQIDEAWLILPLLIEKDIVGFIILSHPKDGEQPNWEDLDLAKTVGRQIANYLTRHKQSELLAQARQFETFNKLSAFVMHDLKNLIAQQSLVVKNAEKHKDNPAFVEDAINTIKNSVDRMNNLLSKLRQNEPEETKVIAVKDLLIEATKRCQKYAPAPTLMHVDDSVQVKADFDSLAMVFTHLIHNAQDATSASGFVDIQTSNTTGRVHISIEDNGEGMTEEFIRTKLFQPFESTKAGKGMGVGVYQAREYIESLGGTITVESQLGHGTKFGITIPLAEA